MSGSFYGTTATVITGDDSIDGIITGHKWSSATIYYSFTSSSAVYDYDTDAGVYSEANYSVLTDQQQDAVNFALNAEYDGGGATTAASTAGFSVEGFTSLGVVLDTTPDTTSQEHIRYANTSSAIVGTARVADFPGDYISPGEADDNGDVWFNSTGATPTAGNFDWATVLHETGHALGLKHGHTTGGTVNGTTALPAAEDSLEFSVMTYQSYIGQDRTVYNYNTTETWGAPQTYMMNDIAALQHLYGADFTTNSDDTTYSWNPGPGDTLVNGTVGIDAGGNVIFATIWDGGGTDTYDLSAYASDLTIDLAPGGWSIFDETQLADLGATGPGVGVEIARGSIFNARQYNGDARSLIENAIGGSGDDDISGNEANNTLTGNGGDDILTGEGGNDTLIGGAGIDVMYGGNGNDTFWYSASHGPTGLSEYLSGGNGDDRVLLMGAGTFAFGNDFDVHSVEEIEFGFENGIDKTLTLGGKELDGAHEWLNVNIDGNNSAGSDDSIIITMSLANLTLAGWTFEDWVSASAGGNNTDRIYIWGNADNNTITGSSEDDVIDGGDGNDTINGGDGDDLLSGGAGVDTLNGDGGNDTIYSGADGGTYNGGAGDDLMYSASGAEWMDGGADTDTINHTAISVSYTFNLATGATNFIFESFTNFENAIMGDGDDIVTGTTGANEIHGGSGNDTIDDGAGGDTIYGEGGDDTFLAGDSSFGDGDTWDGGDGTDTLSYQNHNWGAAVVTFDLGLGTATYNGFSETFTSIENFIGSGGNDVVAGSGGVNVISLLGGNDTLIHAVLGGDSYDGGDGNDTLRSNELWASGVHFSLLDGKLTYNNTDRDTFVGFENLEIGGSAQLTGDNGNNVLTALSGVVSHHNVINGLGGNDTINGGGGDDTLNGGDGDDTIDGGDEDDTIDDGDGGDTVSGGDGDDLFLAGDTSFGNGDTWDGGDGTDTLSFQYHDWGTPVSEVLFNLTSGRATYATGTETFTSIENFIGSDGDETIRGSAGSNVIDGRDGDDKINGEDGIDVINGGAGDDIITDDDGFYAAGADTIDGGAGNDTLVSNLNWHATVHFNLATGRGSFNGTDFDTYTSIENVSAGGSARIIGDGNDNILTGLSSSSGHHNTINGGGGNDTINGGGGADTLNGDAGNDTIDGGTEDDAIDGGTGNDTLSGGDGNDTLNGGDGADTANGGTGNDLIDGGWGNDVLNGDDGDDVVNGNTGDDTLNGGIGDDTLDGGAGADTLNGGDGNDVLDGGHGKDDAFGGAGRDRFVMTGSDFGDNVDGGSGIDTLDLSGWLTGAGLTASVNLITGGYEVVVNTFGADGTYTLNSIENVFGSAYDDVIQGDGRRNLLRGNDGNDDVIAGGGNDRVYGGDGNDTLAGRNGNDRLYGDAGNDILNGEAGADRLTGGSGEDTLRGGAGNDHMNAGAGDDILIGGKGDDTMIGGGGVDQLDGGAGRDDMQGGGGNDVLNGQGGHDVMDGGGNNDQMEGGGGDDNMSGGKGGDQMQGGSGDDTMNGDAGGDVLDGGTGHDVMDGGTGNDRLTGGSGRDTIAGGAGNDRLYGGNGNDVLDGGAGNDFLDGDAGSDKFVLMSGGGNDVIRDFVDDVDTLRLDQTLWAGTLTRQQVVDTFASIVGDDILFQFVGGESMEVRDAGALGLAAMYDDVALI